MRLEKARNLSRRVRYTSPDLMNRPQTQPADGNFGAMIRSVTAEHGSAPFLIEGAEQTHSYGEIDDLAARYAYVLQTNGAGVGDRVLVQVDKCVEAVALYLACLRAGTVHVPLNPAFTTEDLAYFMGDAEPSVVVVDPESDIASTSAGARPGNSPHNRPHNSPRVLTLAAGGQGTLPGLADERETRTVRAADTAIVERHDDDLAALLYTSGTTGRPKGASLTHANLRHNALALIDTWHFTHSDRLVHCLPLFHTHGLFVALHCAMLCAIPVTFLPRFDTEQVIDALGDATVFMGVPTHYSRLLGDPRFTAESVEHIRLFISGSAPLSESVFAEFTERTKQRICERYGMSETGIITSNPYHGDRLPGTVGYPLPGVELRVVDNTANNVDHTATSAESPELAGAEPTRPQPVGPSVIGSVEVRGPNVFRGYWHAGKPANPDPTANTTPGNTTPGNTAPGNTAPANTTPANTTPANTTPGNTTPGNTTPGNTTPGNTTPGNTTPGNTAPGNTAPATDDDGWFETGDLGSLDEGGRLSLHGRSGDLIISGGENIYPKEVELVLDEVHGIHESAVIGLPHPDLGEAVTAVVVVDEARFSLDDALAELATRLSRFKHPKQILIAASLPRNAMGKVQKNTLRQQHQQTYL